LADRIVGLLFLFIVFCRWRNFSACCNCASTNKALISRYFFASSEVIDSTGKNLFMVKFQPLGLMKNAQFWQKAVSSEREVDDFGLRDLP